MVVKIITDYLVSNRRLILPGLGAFLKKEDDSVVFVPFLNKDDGVLNTLVREAYSVSQGESDAVISEYISSIRDNIGKKGFYSIPPLGTLKTDVNGVIYLDEISSPGISEPVKPVAQGKPAAEEESDKKAATDTPASKPAATSINDLYGSEQLSADAIPAGNSGSVINAKPAANENKGKEMRNTDSIFTQSQPQSAPSKKMDWILIVAVIVAAVAILIMIYSYFVTDMPGFTLG